MEYSKGLPSPDQPGFSANLKPVRRRLQKLTPKAKIFHGHLKRGSHDSSSSNNDTPPAPRQMTNIGAGGVASSLGHNPFADEPSLPLPPDLSDSKWLDYIERSGLMFQEPTVTDSVPKPMRKRPPPIIPELSHLVRAGEGRPSLDSASSGSAPNSASTSSTMRRQAKTPVFRIGQLEGKSAAPVFGRDPWVAAKTSSVELIADQYCALLEHRDAMEEERERELERAREQAEIDAALEDAEASSVYSASSSVYTAYQSEPISVRPQDRLEVPTRSMLRQSYDSSPVNIILEPVRNSTVVARYSPVSTNGTYVGGDDSAIYFKPVSFEQPPPTQTTRETDDHSPSPPTSHRTETPATSPDSLSLHIALDLLTKELTSAFADRSSRAGDASALQVWVMIEAYERLQDQIACMDNLSKEQRGNMQMMFRSWLGTLYAVHDKLLERRTADEREVESLTEAVD